MFVQLNAPPDVKAVNVYNTNSVTDYTYQITTTCAKVVCLVQITVKLFQIILNNGQHSLSGSFNVFLIESRQVFLQSS